MLPDYSKSVKYGTLVHGELEVHHTLRSAFNHINGRIINGTTVQFWTLIPMQSIDMKPKNGTLVAKTCADVPNVFRDASEDTQ